MGEYTEQDRINEGCCWTWQRDQCKGQGCICTCHASGEPERTTYFDLVKEIEGYRQRSRDEDTARINLNHERIRLRDENEQLAARLAASERQVAALTEIAESTDRWARKVVSEGKANIHRVHRDIARAALAAAAARADADDLPPIPPLASYPVTVEISEVRKGKPSAPCADAGTGE